MTIEINSANAYKAIVKGLSKDITTEAMSHHDNDRAEAEELIYDTLLHETIDSTEYIIYTRHHLPIIQYSENDEYMVDNFGAESAGDALKEGGVDRLHQAMAYWALYADVSDLISDELDELENN